MMHVRHLCWTTLNQNSSGNFQQINLFICMFAIRGVRVRLLVQMFDRNHLGLNMWGWHSNNAHRRQCTFQCSFWLHSLQNFMFLRRILSWISLSRHHLKMNLSSLCPWQFESIMICRLLSRFLTLFWTLTPESEARPAKRQPCSEVSSIQQRYLDDYHQPTVLPRPGPLVMTAIIFETIVTLHVI